MIDFIVKLPPSASHRQVYHSVLVVVNQYTKIAKYFPTRETIKAPELADLFLVRIIIQYRSPESIISDRGGLFTSGYWSMFSYSLMIHKKLSTAYHPQTDSQTEYQNQTLENYLQLYVNYLQDNWVSLLPVVEFTYNNSFNTTIKRTPFQMLIDYDPMMEIGARDNILEKEMPHTQECTEYLTHI